MADLDLTIAHLRAAMVDIDPTVAHLRADIKVFKKKQAQLLLQEANYSEHESFEPSDFLDLEGFNQPAMNEEGDNQTYKIKIVNNEPSIQLDSLSSNPPCIQGFHLDHNSSVTQTHDQHQESINPKKSRKRKAERALKYAFLTRSETDILEDGYKWRKYGKKFVKNSPNPRNYYRCSDSNCNVKKTVERDACDKGIVITSYLGRHNHESPCVIYYIAKPDILQLQRQVPTGSPVLQHLSSFCNYVPGNFEQHQ